MNRKEEEKARYERLIFTDFAKAANTVADFSVNLESVKSEEPPKPDISCTIDGQRNYFEMTEITDQGLARNVSISIKKMKITGRFFSQDEPLIKAFSSKAKKTYPPLDGPLELLAYYDKQYPPPTNLIQESTLNTLCLIIRDMTIFGPWSRLWIYDQWNKNILGCVSDE